jgi:hypothetical protein
MDSPAPMAMTIWEGLGWRGIGELFNFNCGGLTCFQEKNLFTASMFSPQSFQ